MMPEWVMVMVLVCTWLSGFFSGLGGAWWMLKKIMKSGDLPNIDSKKD